MTEQQHKSYQTKGREHPEKGPTFDLNDHHFEAKPFVPEYSLIEFTHSSGSILPFFELVLGEEEAERFAAVCRDPAEEVAGGVVAEIFGDLYAWYLGRPTTRSSNSQDGRPSTPTTSQENSSSQDTTPTPSPTETG
jgi:hypothetical protein